MNGLAGVIGGVWGYVIFGSFELSCCVGIWGEEEKEEDVLGVLVLVFIAGEVVGDITEVA